MKKLYFTSAIFLITSCLLFSQDVHFARFWMTPLLVNPAQAGAEHDMRAILNYRNQWNSVATPFSTANISFDMKLGKHRSRRGFSAAGVNIFQDQAGDAKMKSSYASLSYAYHVFLNDESTVGAGLYGGFSQRSVNYSNLQWMNQYDGNNYNAAIASGEQSGGTSLTYLDLGTGVHYEYGKGNVDFSAGASLFHANRASYSFYGTDEKLHMKMSVYTNALVWMGKSKFSILPGLLFVRQGASTELFLGSMVRYALSEGANSSGTAVSLGAHYRNKDAFVPVLMLEVAQFSIGFSYDANISQLRTASNGRGGFEISLRFVQQSSKSSASFNR